MFFSSSEPAPIEEFNCTFEAPGLCVFSQDGTDQFNLVKYRAADNQNPFAMNRDHTFSNGTGNTKPYFTPPFSFLSHISCIKTKRLQLWAKIHLN